MDEAEEKKADESALPSRKPVMLFGRNIVEIKCFRESFLYGISGGIAAGLIAFLFTSKVTLSSNVAFGAGWVFILGVWFPCRYKYEKQLILSQKIKETMQERIAVPYHGD